jgi:dTMP kinase
MNSAPGRLIVIEGMDGSGTTTQVGLLCDWLRGQGWTVAATREPTAGPVGRFLRSALRRQLFDEREQPVELDWAAMALLFAADRMDHLTRTILPALERGEIVVSDRYYLSSLLYQSLTSPLGSAAVPWLTAINAQARRPDLTLVLDLPEEVAGARRAIRGEEPELYEYSELQRQLSDGYRQAEILVPGDALHHVAATAPVADVARHISEIVAQFLSRPE